MTAARSSGSSGVSNLAAFLAFPGPAPDRSVACFAPSLSRVTLIKLEQKASYAGVSCVALTERHMSGLAINLDTSARNTVCVRTCAC